MQLEMNGNRYQQLPHTHTGGLQQRKLVPYREPRLVFEAFPIKSLKEHDATHTEIISLVTVVQKGYITTNPFEWFPW